jgi:hypothetical protein
VVPISGTVAVTGVATETTLAAMSAKVTACNTGAVVVSSSALPADAATQATLSALNTKVTACNTGAVTISAAIPAGDNNIGNVDIVTMPTVTVQATDLDIRNLTDITDLVGTVEKPQAMCVDEASSTVTYQAWAPPGTATASAGWRIRKITVSGTVTSITWADGDALYNNVWDNRAGLSYS